MRISDWSSDVCSSDLARAVIGRPEILVADEPTGNVDPDMAQRLLHLFETLNKLGTTVVVATHDIHLLSRLRGAQMMRLDKGRLSDQTGLLRYPPRRPQTGGRGPEPAEDRTGGVKGQGGFEGVDIGG